MEIILHFPVFLPDAKGKAVLKIKQDGILAGMEVAEKIFEYKEPGSFLLPIKKMVIK